MKSRRSFMKIAAGCGLALIGAGTAVAKTVGPKIVPYYRKSTQFPYSFRTLIIHRCMSAKSVFGITAQYVRISLSDPYGNPHAAAQMDCAIRMMDEEVGKVCWQMYEDLSSGNSTPYDEISGGDEGRQYRIDREMREWSDTGGIDYVLCKGGAAMIAFPRFVKRWPGKVEYHEVTEEQAMSTWRVNNPPIA